MQKVICCIVFIVLFIVGDSAFAATFTVTGTTDPSPPPACVAGDCPSLRAAVIAANTNAEDDTIVLSAGTYQLEIAGAAENAALTGDLDIINSVTIVGDTAENTIIDGGMLDRVIHIFDVNPVDAIGVVVSLQNITVQNGSVTDENGGGIFLEAPEGGVFSPEASNSRGQVSISLEVLDSVVTNNRAISVTTNPDGTPVGGSGAGIYSTSFLAVDNSVISFNFADANGGGVYSGSEWTLVESTVANNEAEGGGGIFDTGSHLSVISQSTLSANLAVGGGAINARTNVTLNITNTTIDGNRAMDVGAGINSNGTVNLLNVTVTDNDSDSDSPNGGAGLNSFASGTFRLWNTLLSNNRVAAADIPALRNCGCTGGSGCIPLGQFLPIATNLDSGDSCGLNVANGDLINTEPLLLPLLNYGGVTETRALQPVSPAIDAGTNQNPNNDCPSIDQRNTSRPQAGMMGSPVNCDIGAVEFDQSTDFTLDIILDDGFESIIVI